ncbi:hypothetical protein [Pseudohongiella sp.]|uniref:Lipoprotein n=1 Tax=marine sediment metagenome TaxID=412755 RepID=A0A0F9YL52_9ZZZZ|nr:hypothetical protein [Pseudohongiella sp.]HDZ10520.1 hypothetical protein [Pseudohongiella sp.]HEA63845.1 hypothetical protein [Pseudohongiella sp.]
MRTRQFALSVMLATALTACGGMSSYVAPPASERLIPEITEEGTKFFVLQRDYLRPEQNTDTATPARPRGRAGDELLMGERNIEQRLTLIMERTAYCREGFFELYREQTLSGFSVRGECREDATDADRERFSTGPIPL